MGKRQYRDSDGDLAAMAEVGGRVLDYLWDGMGELDTQDVEDLACFAVHLSGDGEMARMMGIRNGSRGGHMRAARLTHERRSEISRQAAMKRWHGTPTEDPC